MKNFKRIIAGATALTAALSLTGCGDSSSGTGSADTTPASTADTTTVLTVEVNTETLAEEDQNAVNDVTELLTDVELENKTIKWFSFYDPFHATTAGNTKSISLELFEAKYDGEIEYVPTTWEAQFTDLATRILGGDGIDFIAGGDLDSFPKGVTNGQFIPYDEYIDWDSELWSAVKDLNDQFIIGDNHYLIATQAAAGEVVVYNKKTIEEFGFEDPVDLLENNEWTWSAFKNMLLEYCDNENECYGLDGWFNEKPLMLSGGVAPVELKDGQLVSNLYDASLEKAMNFMYELNQKGLTFDKGLYDWQTHPEFIAEGKELFYITGLYALEGSHDIWGPTFGDAEDVMFVPIPRMDDSDTYYLPAGMEAYMLCKGAGNPEGVARFMECTIAANYDQRTIDIGIQKRKDDYGWTDEMIEMQDKIKAMTAEHPMYSIHTGCPTDMYSLLDSGEYGIRCSFYGIEWAGVRDALSEAIDELTAEFNASLAELQ